MSTGAAFNPWVMCNLCRDVHRIGDRTMRQFGKWRGFSVSHCPKCDSTVQAPRAAVPLQRDIFGAAA